MIRYSDVAVGTDLPSQTFELSRSDLVRYAGASGDFNPIHWSQETAVGVGLPDVIAHGMLTMAMVARVATDWVGNPGAVLDYGVRFTRPIVVSFGSAALLEVGGVVRSLSEDDGTAEIGLTATVDDRTVLAKARIVVRLER
jgi:hydroxyacyl-ACP dehydratase HTD2-like protein with hotdog domain